MIAAFLARLGLAAFVCGAGLLFGAGGASANGDEPPGGGALVDGGAPFDGGAFADGVAPVPGAGIVISGGERSVSRPVKLGLHKSLVVDLPRDARDVLVSNPAIADAIMRTSRRIYVTGVRAGQSNIIIFDRAGNQIVSLDLQVGEDTGNLAALINQYVPGAHVSVEYVSGNIVLSGSVRNAQDARKALDIADAFLGLKTVSTTVGTNTGTSEAGSSGGDSEARAAGTEATTSASAATGQLTVINLLTIEGEDQIHLKVTVAEVNRNSIKQLGIDWDASISIGNMIFEAVTNLPFAVGARPENTASVGWDNGSSSVDATVRMLEQAGVLRTLAEPTLTAISGEQASFLAGGEFPVPVPGEGGISIDFKPFGVALSFAPVVLSEGRISLKVKTEVSELSTEGALPIGSLSVPALKVRRAESTLELPSGGSLVMAGLLQDSVRQSISGLPGLKNLPVLGTLFRSRDFQRNETELVIIVTPYLVNPVARPALARPDDGLSTSNDYDATFLGHINNIYGGSGKTPDGSYHGVYGYIYE